MACGVKTGVTTKKMDRLISAYYAWLAKRRLIGQYRYLNAVNEYLEKYITERILNGGSSEFINKGRTDLVGKQNEMKENANFINFLRKQ